MYVELLNVNIFSDIATAVGTTVKVMPGSVRMYGVGLDCGCGRTCVLLPTTAKLADGARDTTVLEIVMAAPPAVRVAVPATHTDAEFAVNDCPAIEITAGLVVVEEASGVELG